MSDMKARQDRTTDTFEAAEGSRHNFWYSDALRSEYSSIWWALALLIVVCGVFAPNTLGTASLLATLPTAAIIAVAGIGQTLVIQQRGLDLSVAGNMTLSACVLSVFSIRHSWPLLIALMVILVVAILIGSLIGLLVSVFGITPLVTTLSVNALLIGGVQSYTGGFQATPPEPLVEVMTSRVAGLQGVVWIAIATVLSVTFLMRKTTFGRRFVGTGANPLAVSTSGILVRRYVMGTYVIASMTFALAGLMLAGYVGSTSTTMGNNYLLPVVAAVIVGGTPLVGGRGSIIATSGAAVFLALLVQFVLSLGAPTSAQLLVQAVAIGLATVSRRLASRR